MFHFTGGPRRWHHSSIGNNASSYTTSTPLPSFILTSIIIMPISGSPIVKVLSHATTNRPKRLQTTDTPISPLSNQHHAVQTQDFNIISASGDISDNDATRPTHSHKKHDVLTLCQRATISRWMIAETEHCGNDKHIQTKAIKKFPQFFRSGHSANYMRAKKRWEERVELVADLALGVNRNKATALSVSAVTKHGQRRLFTKARA